jgi:DnaJ C terminal domain
MEKRRMLAQRMLHAQFFFSFFLYCSLHCCVGPRQCCRLQVPPGTQPGTVLRIRGRGAPQLNNLDNRGDQYVTVKVRAALY